MKKLFSIFLVITMFFCTLQMNVYAVDNKKEDTNDSIDLEDMFDIGGFVADRMTPIPDKSLLNGLISVNKNVMQVGNKAFADANGIAYGTPRLLSKFVVDMNRSFSLKGKMTSRGLNPDGFVMGIMDSGSKDIFLPSTVGSGGLLGIYDIPVKGAIIYEVDYYSNNNNAGYDKILDENLPIVSLFPHTMLAYIKDGNKYKYTNPISFSVNQNQDSRELIIEYDKSTDIFKIGYGTMISEYPNASELIGDEGRIFFCDSINYAMLSPGGSGYLEMDIRVDSFKYVDADPQNTVEGYVKRDGELVKYDELDYTTYPTLGETVLIRSIISNKDDINEDMATTVNISTSKLDSVNRAASNLKMYTGSPEVPIEETMDETEIFNGTVDENGIYKQMSVPLLKNQANTYIEYEYTIPTDKKYKELNDTIVFGQKGMTQWTYESNIKIASTPNIKGAEKPVVFPKGTGDMSDAEIRSGMTGRLFDESDYGDLVSDMTNLTLSYEIDGSKDKKIDKTKEGRYKAEYTATDKRTELKESVSRFLWVTDKQVVITKDESIAAQDFIMTVDEVKSSQFMDIVKTRSGVEAYESDGTEIPFFDLKMTHTIKAKAGKYKVTFETPSGTSITIEVKCSVFEHSVIDPETGESIYANDFTLSESQTSLADDDLLKELSSVKAKDSDGKEIVVRVKENTVKDKTQGRYPVTFVTDKGTSITVNAQVTKKSVEANGERLMGNDFLISAKDAKNKDVGQILELAKAEAIDIATQTKVDIHVNADALKPEKGDYIIALTTDKGTTLNVTATVTDRENINPETGEAIYANNFTLDVDEVKTLTDNILIAKAKAKAINIEGGQDVVITKVEHDIKAVGGLYDVTFKTTKGTSITVIASIPNTVENDTLILAANPFTVSVEEVRNGLSDSDLLSFSNAKAKEKATTNNVDVLVKDKTLIKALPGVYPITFITDYIDASKNLELTVNVTVTEKGIVNPDTGESLNANDIYLTRDEVKGLTDKIILKKANAEARNIISGERVDIYIEHSIKALPGIYEIKLTTSKGTELKINAYVYDNGIENVDTREGIYGNDIILTIDEVKVLTNQGVLDKSQAKAIDIDTRKSVKIEKVDRSLVKEERGTYQVELSTMKGTKLNINIKVVENMINKDNVILSANHIHIGVKEVQGLTETKIIELSQASAKNTITNELLNIVVDSSQIKANKGIYDIELKTEKDVELIIKAYVYDEGVIDDINNESIIANDFVISLQEAKGITDKKIKEYSKVYAFDIDKGNKITDIIVKHNIIDQIGVYNVEFSTKKGTTIRVKARVSSEVVETNGERISANNFDISIKEVEQLNEAKAIEKANAYAEDIETGKLVSIQADITQVKAERGIYSVVFKSEKGTEVIVKANVLEEGITDDGNHESIYGNDFVLGSQEVEKITDERIKELSNVKAIDDLTKENVEVNVKHDIKAVKGDYFVVFTTTKGTKLTVKANVFDYAVEDGKTNEAITAYDMRVNIKEVKSLTEDKVKELSKAKAYNLSTKKEVPLHIDYSEIIEKVGNYYVTLLTEAGTKLIIKATVYDNSVIDIQTKESIYANDISITSNQAKTITNTIIKELTHAYAIDTVTGIPVEIKRITHNIKPQAGVYKIEFETEKGTRLSVKAEVIKNQESSPDIIPDIKQEIKQPIRNKINDPFLSVTTSNGTKIINKKDNLNQNDNISSSKSNQDNKLDKDVKNQKCISHWIMLGSIIIYIGYMFYSIRKDENDE